MAASITAIVAMEKPGKLPFKFPLYSAMTTGQDIAIFSPSVQHPLVIVRTIHPDLDEAEQTDVAEAIIKRCNVHDALVDQLLAALPFLEDLEEDASYKAGAVKKRIAAMRAVLTKAGAI